MPNGKYLLADNPLRAERDLTIAEESLKGSSQREIASKTGISLGRVNQLLSDTKIKAQINKAQRIIASHSVPISKRLLQHAYDTEDKAISLKAIQEVMKITGIAPNHTQSIFINNLFMPASQADPAFQALAKRFIESEDIINVTPVSSEQDQG